jgi:hypothetical protein
MPYKDTDDLKSMPLTSKPVTSMLRKVAEYHGYLATRGPRTGQGDVVELAVAIGTGELATVLLADEQRHMVMRFLNGQAKIVDDFSLAEALESVARQIYASVEREREANKQESEH